MFTKSVTVNILPKFHHVFETPVKIQRLVLTLFPKLNISSDTFWAIIKKINYIGIVKSGIVNIMIVSNFMNGRF